MKTYVVSFSQNYSMKVRAKSFMTPSSHDDPWIEFFDESGTLVSAVYADRVLFVKEVDCDRDGVTGPPDAQVVERGWVSNPPGERPIHSPDSWDVGPLA